MGFFFSHQRVQGVVEASPSPDPTPAAPEPEDDALVERALSLGYALLRFEPALERRFVDDTAPERLRLIVRNSVGGALLFAVMLLTDHLMVPDQFQLAMWLRLGVFVPVCVLGSMAMSTVPSPALREWLVGAGGALATLLCLLIVLPSHSMWAPCYVATIAVVVVYINTVQRMRFWPAVVVTGLAIGEHFYAVLRMPGQGNQIAVATTLFLFCVAVGGMYCNYCLEKDERHAYLLRARQRSLKARLRAANERLSQHARIDPLTGLPNRRHFDEFLQHAWEQAVQRQHGLSLLVIDVDHFKAYNDRYGHQAGDECLRSVAQALADCLRRPSDLVARWGGEEFAVVLSNTEPTMALHIAERMLQAVADLDLPHEDSSCAAVVTVSIGVACANPSSAPRDGLGLSQLIHDADVALYNAKASGRNRIGAAIDLGSELSAEAAA